MINFSPRYMDVSENRGTPKWMVYNEKPIEMDDLGVPLFLETPIYKIGEVPEHPDEHYLDHSGKCWWLRCFGICLVDRQRKRPSIRSGNLAFPIKTWKSNTGLGVGRTKHLTLPFKRKVISPSVAGAVLD